MTAQPKIPTFTREEIAATRRSLNLIASQLPAQYRNTSCVDSVYLKDILREVQTNGSNCHDVPPLGLRVGLPAYTLPLKRSEVKGGVHSINSALFVNRSQSTYKSGKAVQTSGTTSDARREQDGENHDRQGEHDRPGGHGELAVGLRGAPAAGE